MATEPTLGARAVRTRTAILDAAETLFSERGFNATRLEDVAERVGIRRASIVYYFKDKRELYGVVLESVFSGLFEAIRDALSGPEPLMERIETGVAAWVDYVSVRPSIARLILRETANATPEHRSPVLELTQPFFSLIEKEVFQREDDLPTAEVDPVHLASTIAGATIFFFAAMPALVPQLEIDPTSAHQVEVHKQQVLHIVRRLLETG